MTEKEKLTREGWTNLAQDIDTGEWYGLFRGLGGYWLGANLTGKRQDEWVTDENWREAVARLAAIGNKRILSEVWE